MTDRVFEDPIGFTVLSRFGSAELYLFEDRSVQLKVSEGRDLSIFSMTAEEATAMKEFLIEQGY
jgi:hypothetical protein